MRIRDLFRHEIDRHIEEVIKVDQTEETALRRELEEYVATDSIRRHYLEIFEAYNTMRTKPSEGTAVWVSGFFGSGKSSLAKNLGLALENRPVGGEGAGELLAQQLADNRATTLLGLIHEHIPTKAVIFDVSSDRGVQPGQTLTDITYRVVLRELGYSRDRDLAELEMTVEGDGRLSEFVELYEGRFGEGAWERDKSLITFGISRASQIAHAMYPETYLTETAWVEAQKGRADITPSTLAERALKLMDRRHPGKALTVVIDEVGQFVARDVQKMLDLQALVQNFGRVGKGRLWLVATSQEKLTEIVSGLDDARVELARLMDRFPLQVHLEPSDISEVASRRVLSKTSEGEAELHRTFDAHRGRLEGNTRLSADISLPTLERDEFANLYPLLPWHIDLIINVVSGLRTQGGASKHVGGANRTIIKLAQQLLIHPDVDLASEDVGALTTLDQVYDLVAGNIPSELRQKIDGVRKQVPDHPAAPAVAKVVCLLQYVKSIHRTEENIAALLHHSVNADSRLAEVKVALAALEAAHLVKQGEDGYRIPSPQEDDWERRRNALSPRLGDENRLITEALSELWKPQPSHELSGIRSFTAGLERDGRMVVEGNAPFRVSLASAEERDDRVEEARSRSREETGVFWVAELSEELRRQAQELFRSKEMITANERDARTREEATLVQDERRREQRARDELKRRLRDALLRGAVFFRGNDRSPEDTATDLRKAASDILARVLPQVYERFEDGAARVASRDLDTFLKAETLKGLPSVFRELNMLREENGQLTFRLDAPPLVDVRSEIQKREELGQRTPGKHLEEHFGRPPYGWSLDVVRLAVVSLVRAGVIEAVSGSQTISTPNSAEGQALFPNNAKFRQASFRPCEEVDAGMVIEVADRVREVFGEEVPDISSAAPVAEAIRKHAFRAGERIHHARQVLREARLPTGSILDTAHEHLKAVHNAPDVEVIRGFHGTHRDVGDALKRVAELEPHLDEASITVFTRAREVLEKLVPELEGDGGLSDEFSEAAEELRDLLAKETFFRERGTIDKLASSLRKEHQARKKKAVEARKEAYEAALASLEAMDGWSELDPEQQESIRRPLAERAEREGAERQGLALLREAVNSCPTLLARARQQVSRQLSTSKVVEVSVSKHIPDRIENEDQLEQALEALRQACLHELGQEHTVMLGG